MFMGHVPATPCRHGLIADEIAAIGPDVVSRRRIAAADDAPAALKLIGPRPAIPRGASAGAHRLAPRSHLETRNSQIITNRYLEIAGAGRQLENSVFAQEPSPGRRRPASRARLARKQLSRRH